MADVTVTQFANALKVSLDKLIAQLDQAGIAVDGPEAMISEEAKLELLTHLRRSHGSAGEGSAPARITLKRKSQSELKLASVQGRARTVNVEVRRQRTYVNRGVLEEQARQQQEQVDQQRRDVEEAQRRQLEKAEAERSAGGQARGKPAGRAPAASRQGRGPDQVRTPGAAYRRRRQRQTQEEK